jgi:hypothetical protein
VAAGSAHERRAAGRAVIPRRAPLPESNAPGPHDMHNEAHRAGCRRCRRDYARFLEAVEAERDGLPADWARRSEAEARREGRSR